MRPKVAVAIFTFLVVILSVSFVALIKLNHGPTLKSVLGTATQSDLETTSAIDYIKHNTDGSTEIKYVFTIKNISSTYDIVSLQANDSLSDTFAPHSFQIIGFTSDGLALNSSYNGSTNTNLLSTGNVLDLGTTRKIYLTVKFFPEGSTGPFNNTFSSDGDISLPPSEGSGGFTTGSTTGGSGTSGTPPTGTTSSSGGTTTGGSNTTTGGSTGGTTIGEPPPVPVSEPTTSTGSGSTTTTGGTTGTTDGSSTTGGTTGGTTSGDTAGGSPNAAAASQVSFTLTTSGGQGTITQVQLPYTSRSTFHTGVISYLNEWIKDNVLDIKRNKIIIDSIGVDGEIEEGSNESTLDSGFWRMPDSSTPDAEGNMIIAGHRFTYNYGPYTFYNLDKLKIGDVIKVNWNNKVYSYTVQDLKLVNPNNTNILKQTQAKILTLITCTGFNPNSDRLVVQAVLNL